LALPSRSPQVSPGRLRSFDAAPTGVQQMPVADKGRRWRWAMAAGDTSPCAQPALRRGRDLGAVGGGVCRAVAEEGAPAKVPSSAFGL